MPNFDGGHYFLTALIPIRTEDIEDQGVFTSPVHALRKVLAKLPASPTLQFETPPSPFARVRGLHFARLAVIDDVAYNGRIGENPILARIRRSNPIIAQSQDHLSRPYLLLAMDFDVLDGSDGARNAFLQSMWGAMEKDLAEILSFAVGFDRMPSDASGFAAYIAECQIATTMSFNDYYVDPLDVGAWRQSDAVRPYAIAGLVGGLCAGLGVIEVMAGFVWPVLFFLGAFFLVSGLALMVAMIMRVGNAPFPTDARTTLPNVLKALHIQRVFTAFAIDNQGNAARDTGEAALHANFAAFLATHQPSVPGPPTQEAGVLGL